MTRQLENGSPRLDAAWQRHGAAQQPPALPQGAPLSAQYLHAMGPLLPESVRSLPPTSRAYRNALQTLAASLPLQLMPSRRELAAGARYLAERSER